MEEYIAVVERQSRFFRAGETAAAKELDTNIQRLKSHRETAINALMKHRSTSCQHGAPAVPATRALRTVAPRQAPARSAKEPKSAEPMAWPEGARLLGIDSLDNDHAALAKTVRELGDRIRKGASDDVQTLLSRLFDEARSHFCREEQAMMQDQYPRVEHHKEAHHRLLAYVEFLKQDVGAGRTALDETMIDNLWDWLNAHIATEDRSYAKHIQWRPIDHRRATRQLPIHPG